MDYEKKYREAQKWIESIYSELSHEQQMEAEAFFPELKESEDEKVRKVLIDYFNRYKEQEECGIGTFFGISTDNILAWLEKQGEKTQQTPQWMIDFLDDNRSKFASLMEDYDEQREAEGKLLAIIAWLEKQGKQKPTEWSEKDENILEDTKEAVINTWGGDTQDIILEWLESLKQRIGGEGYESILL